METGSIASAAVILVIMEVGKTLGHHSMRTASTARGRELAKPLGPRPSVTLWCVGV